jgi:DNA-binding MarR family transcriptional regulator
MIDITSGMSYSVPGCNAMKNLIEIQGENPILRTFILFQQTVRVVKKYQDAYLYKEVKLSDVKFIVLMAFYYDPTSAVTASEIAQWTDTEPHNVTTLINRMKQDGLLKAERDKKDKRFLKIKLTDRGREVFQRAMPAAQQVLDQLMSSIDQNDVLPFEKVLKIIRQNAYDGLERLTENS